MNTWDESQALPLDIYQETIGIHMINIFHLIIAIQITTIIAAKIKGHSIKITPFFRVRVN